MISPEEKDSSDVGSRSALLISLSGSAEWPTELPSAVASFIAAIRVP
jgi:hypothetical protein